MELPSWHDTLDQVQRVVAGLDAVELARPEYAERLDRVPGPVQTTFVAASLRYERIRQALVSAGINTRDAGELRRLIADGPAPGMHLELTLVLREIGWRLHELGREVRLRVQRQAPDHLELADFAVRSFTTRYNA